MYQPLMTDECGALVKYWQHKPKSHRNIRISPTLSQTLGPFPELQ
jgi:hypothetical protein